MDITIEPRGGFKGQVKVPGDKSISHRALILSSLVEGTVEIEGLLKADDPLSTLHCLKSLGVEIAEDKVGQKVILKGVGLHNYIEPGDILDAGNSGTTARLLLGVLAGQPIFTVLTGDRSLRKRPMGRVSEPLKMMGAQIDGRAGGTLLPFSVRGTKLKPLHYVMPVASAQVKSAILLASLYTQGNTVIAEDIPSRDHTERMLLYLGARISREREGKVVIENPFRMAAESIRVPGDISSAAFFLVAAALSHGGELVIEEVGINPTRTGILNILLQMGARVEIFNQREYNLEPVADLYVKGGVPLKGVEITAEVIPSLVDEIPVLAVAALFAEGETVIRGAGELRVKETDRLQALSSELGKMGGKIKEMPDGLVIQGGAHVCGARCQSHGDHRIAMALAVAALYARGETVIEGVDAVPVSFPGFFEMLDQLSC